MKWIPGFLHARKIRRAGPRRAKRVPRLFLEPLERRDLLSDGITLFPVPNKPNSNFQGGDLAICADNNLWFLESDANRIARMTSTGQVTEFPALATGAPGSVGLAGIALGPDQNVWFDELFGVNGSSAGNITTAGAVTQFSIPISTSGGRVPGGGGITAGPDGNLWLTSGAARGAATGFVVQLSTAGTSLVIPLPGANPSPLGITTGSDNNLWFTESGANVIQRVTTAGTLLAPFSIPTANSAPARITVGPADNLYFTEPGADQIGEVTTNGQFTEFPVPIPNSGPNGIVEGPDGNLWITLQNTGQIARMTPDGSFTIFNVPASNVDLTAIVIGPDRKSIWFLAAGNPGQSYIGEITVQTNLEHVGPTNADLPTSCASGDGRFVIFTSNAQSVVPGEVNTNGQQQVYVLDQVTGITTLVSHVAGAPATAGDASAQDPAISVDGNWVAFDSASSNLVSGQTGPSTFAQVFLFNRQTGTISLVSHNSASAATEGNDQSFNPVLGADGKFVAYLSNASDLVAGFSAAATTNVFLGDITAGTSSLVSHNAANPTMSANNSSSAPVISDDGRFVTYESTATDLISGSAVSANSNVYLFDDQTGSNALVSHTAASPSTSPGVDSNGAVISANGAFVAFVSPANDLVTNQSGTSGVTNVFLYNVQSGSVTLVSGADGSASVTANANSDSPSIDGNGDTVAFRSDATNLFSAQTGTSGSNIFVFHPVSGMLTLVSHSTAGNSQTANGSSTDPVIDGDGSFVAYLSTASDLVKGESGGGGAANAFVWASSPDSSFLTSGTNGSGTVASSGGAFTLTISRDPVVFFNHSGNLIVSTDHAMHDYADALVQISLTPSPLTNGSPSGTVAGTLTVTSQLIGQFVPPQISLPAGGGADNGLFSLAQAINTASLLTQFQINVAQQSSFNILVQASVPGLGNFQVPFSLGVTGTAGGGPLTVAYVTQLFSDLLRRPPDNAGLANFTQALDAATRTSQQIATTLITSSEYHTIEVENAYQTILKRNAQADPNGLAFWAGFLNSGNTLVQLQAQFYGSAEFFNNNGGTNTTLVAALYEDILRRPADASSSGWVQQLNNGVAPAAVAGAILASQEADTLVVEVLYLSFLHRQVDAGGLQSNVNALLQGATQEQVLAALVSSAEYQQLALADLDQQYVGNLYLDALNRVADPGGLAGFTGPLDAGAETRSQVVQGLVTSMEYRTDVVQSLYKQYLNRSADSLGLSGDVAALSQGATDEAVAAILIASGEFFADNGSNNTGFVQALYKDILQRMPTSGEVNGWVTLLQNGASRIAVAGAFLVSDEYHRLVVNALYEHYLRRAADSSGLNGLAAALNSGKTDEFAIAVLTTSAEYFERG